MTAIVARPSTTERDSLVAELEDLWRRLDLLLAGIDPAGWTRRHGPDWIFADLPFHLAYFDRELVAGAISRGSDVPPDDRWRLQSLDALADWNARQFARRPAGQPVERSLVEMHAGRDAVRRAVAGLGDGDLERTVWIPLFGWRTVRAALETCLCHTWGHTMELRLRLRRLDPAPAPSQTRLGLGFYAGILAASLDRDRAAGTSLTVVLDFTGPGGGAWTLHVDDGVCPVAPGRAGRPDLTLTQTPETFVATMVGLQNPMVAMLTGKLKVRGIRHLPTFAKLFHPPAPAQPLALSDHPIGTLLAT